MIAAFVGRPRQLAQNAIDIVVRPGNSERFAVFTKLDFACHWMVVDPIEDELRQGKTAE